MKIRASVWIAVLGLTLLGLGIGTTLWTRRVTLGPQGLRPGAEESEQTLDTHPRPFRESAGVQEERKAGLTGEGIRKGSAKASSDPDDRRGRVHVSWLGEAVLWKTATLRIADQVWELSPEQMWADGPRSPDKWEIDIDGLRGEAPAWKGDHWSVALIQGTQFLPVDAETQAPLPQASLAWPGEAPKVAAGGERFVVPAVSRPKEARLEAPGYVSRGVELQPRGGRWRISLQRGLPVELRAELSGPPDKYRLRIRPQGEATTRHEATPRTRDHREMLSLPRGSYIASLERRVLGAKQPSVGFTPRKIKRHPTEQSWLTLDRAEASVGDQMIPSIVLSDRVALSELHGTLALPVDPSYGAITLKLLEDTTELEVRALKVPTNSETLLSWSLADLAPGSYALTTSPGQLSVPVRISRGVSPDPVHLDLSRTFPIQVRVYASETGAALEGAWINATHQMQGPIDEVGSGLYRGPCLAGPNILRVRCSDYLTKHVPIVLQQPDQLFEVGLEPFVRSRFRLEFVDEDGPLHLDLQAVLDSGGLELRHPDGHSLELLYPSVPRPVCDWLSFEVATAASPLNLWVEVPGFEAFERMVELRSRQTRVEVKLVPRE